MNKNITLSIIVSLITLSGIFIALKNPQATSNTQDFITSSNDSLRNTDSIVDQLDNETLSISKKSEFLKSEQLNNSIDSASNDEGHFNEIHTFDHKEVHAFIEELKASFIDPSNSSLNRMLQAKEQLLQLALKNPDALNKLILSLRDNALDPILSEHLVSILSEIKDPEVEQLGYDLSLSNNKYEQLIGLQLLGDLKIPNEKTVSIMQDIINSNQNDPDLLLPAMHAMNAVFLPKNKTDKIMQTLQALTIHDNESIRSESLFALGKWAKTEEHFTPIVNALESSTPDDRASAAMVIESSTYTSESLKNKLLNVLQDESELSHVRAMSANALKRFELNENEFTIYQAFIESVGVIHGG